MSEQIAFIGNVVIGKQVRIQSLFIMKNAKTDYKGVKSAKVKKLKVRKQVKAYVEQILKNGVQKMFFMELVIQMNLD